MKRSFLLIICLLFSNSVLCYQAEEVESMPGHVLEAKHTEESRVPSVSELESSTIMKYIEKRGRKRIHRWFEKVRKQENREEKELELRRVIGRINNRLDKGIDMEIFPDHKGDLLNLKQMLNSELETVSDKNKVEIDELTFKIEKQLLPPDFGLWLLLLGVLALGILIALILIIF